MLLPCRATVAQPPHWFLATKCNGIRKQPYCSIALMIPLFQKRVLVLMKGRVAAAAVAFSALMAFRAAAAIANPIGNCNHPLMTTSVT